MNRKRPRASQGFTLVELVITAAIMSIIALAIGVVIVDSQSSWNVMSTVSTATLSPMATSREKSLTP